MLLDLLMKARSYRNFDPAVRYTDEDIKALINLCRFAPSSVNRQPIRFAYATKKRIAIGFSPTSVGRQR